jgi:predicted porin
LVVAASALITHSSLLAAEAGSGGDWLTVANRLRLEYDDNVYETNTDKTDSFKIIEEVELGVTFNFEPTFITLRYRPTLIWWENREPNDTDWNQDFDIVINHRFSEKLSLGVKDTFRRSEIPQEIDRGTTVSESGDFTYNVADGNIDYRLRPRTSMLVGGRYTMLRYDEDIVADTEDYDIWSSGLTIRQDVTDMSKLLVDYRYEETEYTEDGASNRGSDTQYIGIGLEQVLGASFAGTFRGGYQMKQFEDDGLDDADDPYADVTLTYLFSPRTRFSAGAGYSMFEADVYPFASQDRTIFFASVAHDLTARLSLYFAGSYQISEYKEDQIVANDLSLPSDYGGDEDIIQGSARVAYQINARNSVELNYQYVDLSSDLREEFDRNRVSIGWRLDI